MHRCQRESALAILQITNDLVKYVEYFKRFTVVNLGAPHFSAFFSGSHGLFSRFFPQLIIILFASVCTHIGILRTLVTCSTISLYTYIKFDGWCKSHHDIKKNQRRKNQLARFFAQTYSYVIKCSL